MMMDFWGEGVPNWIMASTSFFTLVAAGVAAYFAGRAAHWTKKQSEASDDQVILARDALEVARADATNATTLANDQRRDGVRNQWALERARLDALAPAVWITAQPKFHSSGADRRGEYALTMKTFDAATSSYGDVARVTEELEIAEGQKVMFEISIQVYFRNISDKVARIDVIEPGGGQFQATQGEPFIVPPRETTSVTWKRQWLSDELSTEEAIGSPEIAYFSPVLWSRDLAQSVRDVHKFNSDLRFFARDGSRLLVRPQPAFPWVENSATPGANRSYERLPDDAQSHGINSGAA